MENKKKYLLETIKNKSLFYTGFSILLNGMDRVSLESTRNGQINRVKKKLKKKYKKEITQSLEVSINEKVPKIIWFCWFQGIDEAPKLVKECYESLKKNFPNYKINIITEKNMLDYIDFPAHIKIKFEKGMISYTHLSDLLRVELLTIYGGIWIDSTVLVTEHESTLPSFFLESELFMFEKLKPGRDGQPLSISSWYICSQKGNPILSRVKELLYKYWMSNNSQIHYFLLHIFIQLVLDEHTDKGIEVKFDSGRPHVLLLNINELFDEKNFKAIIQYCPFHKLSYKGITNTNTNSYNNKIVSGEYKEYL